MDGACRDRASEPVRDPSAQQVECGALADVGGMWRGKNDTLPIGGHGSGTGPGRRVPIDCHGLVISPVETIHTCSLMPARLTVLVGAP